MEITGEVLEVWERIVVSPAAGVFVPADGLPERLAVGTAIGSVRTADGDVRVTSPFAGGEFEVTASAGERVARHQRLGWLRAA